MDSKGCSDYISPAHKPDGGGLACAADLADDSGQATLVTDDMAAAKRGWQEPVEPVGTTCRITLRVTFFFDGTGNNRDADEPTKKNSNVARLFRAHPQNDEGLGLYAFYIPGVATFFPEIGDPGGGATELAMGKGGDQRIQWAMDQLDKVIAAHPPGKTLMALHVNAFGFSRGAAEARAFANRVQKKCTQGQTGWRWKSPDMPVHFGFLGLFDTVASVGLVHTASLTGATWVAEGWTALDTALAKRRDGRYGLGSGLRELAFGAPGADPATGSVGNGHMSWGDEMAIPPVVEKCVHFVAAHEQRNSFPNDSVRVGNRYPDHCEEYVYPGMHSDVGGGYQAGEQGRSLDDSRKLSQLPLLHMHALAIQHGVPLQGIDEILVPEYKAYFQLSPELDKRWNHYMQTAGRGGKPLGQMALAHTRLWYAWRFQRIHAYLQAINGRPGDTLPNEDAVRKAEAGFDRQRAAAQSKVDDAHNDPDWAAAKARLNHASALLLRERQRRSQGLPNDMAAKQADYDAAKADEQVYEDNYHRARATLDAVPGSGAAQGIRAYDLNLIRDVQFLRAAVKEKGKEHGAQNLRPHYRMLLEAHTAEFDGRGLTDPEIIAFFNDYVHDSLAGFAKDLTLPSDPRCYYDGGNELVRYADNDVPSAQQETELAQNGTPSASVA
jgi:hypothetical protein